MSKEKTTSLLEKVREQKILIDRIINTLEVLLERREKERSGIYQTIAIDIRKTVITFIEKMETESLSARARTYLNIIRGKLEKLVSSTTKSKSRLSHDLAPTEMHIIELIKQEKRSKEIAELLNVSVATISFIATILE